MCKFQVGQLVRLCPSGRVYRIRRISIYDMVQLVEEGTGYLICEWVHMDRLQPVSFYQPSLFN